MFFKRSQGRDGTLKNRTVGVTKNHPNIRLIWVPDWTQLKKVIEKIRMCTD
jgi:hypothetical protein